MAGNKNSGRRTLKEEISYMRERIKEVALEELAETKLYGHLEKVEITDRQGVKEIALPVYLKSKADKVDLNHKLNIEFDDAFNSSSETKGDSPKQG